MQSAIMKELTPGENRFAMSWKDVTMSFLPRWQKPDQKVNVLERVTGYAVSGELHCILGGSGSGKTSLLQALAGRLSSHKFDLIGDIEMHGKPLTRFRSVRIATVMQDDLLYPYLTVRETLDLAALFFMSSRTSKERGLRVETVMRELQLTNVGNVRVGSASGKRGVSGGERRRTSIARELICAPRILLCDEVTSGLDAFSALTVIQTLKSLASAGRIVVVAIHQPRSDIYCMFDRLSLLAEGRLVFFGHRAMVCEYFSGFGFRCPHGFNEADFLIDIIAVNMANAETELESRERINSMANLLESNMRSEDGCLYCGVDVEGSLLVYGGGMGRSAARIAAGASADDESKDEITSPSQAESVIEEDSDAPDVWFKAVRWTILTAVVFVRNMLRNIRFFKDFMIQLTIQIFLAAILSLLYYRSGAIESLIIQDRLGLLFFIAINQSFGPCLDASRVFQQEKHIVQHEISAGAYLTSSYFLGRFLATLPYTLISGIISSSIIYFSVGLALDAGKFFIFLGIISSLAVCSQSFGFLVSAVSPNEAVASALATPFIIIFVLTGGFYLNAKSFPPGAEWLVYISNVYYGFSALAVNELSGQVFSCYSSLDNPTICLKNGDQVLAALGIESFSIMEGFIGLFLLTILFLILSFAMLIVFKVRYLNMKPAK